MKKDIIYLLAILSIVFNITFTKVRQGGITIINDLKREVRIKYSCNINGKKIIIPSKRRLNVTGREIYIYVSSKNGTYKLTIPSSRPARATNKFKLSQIMEAAKDKVYMGPRGYYTEKGSIGDIEIFFAKIPFFAD